jgi:hypothetical protein
MSLCHKPFENVPVRKALTDQEKRVRDYEGRWCYRDWDKGYDIPLEKMREDFYLRLMVIAIDVELPKDIDDMYWDQALVNQKWDTGEHRRYFFAGYTPYGIRGIDSYFCNIIKGLKTLEEAYKIEEQLIYCPHLHLKIKENLSQNLNRMIEEISLRSNKRKDK